MSTTTGRWDIPGLDDPAPPVRRQPYADSEPAPAAPEQAPEAPRREAPPAPSPKRGINPLSQWFAAMRADTAARKARSDGRWWLMRWMREQPTSPADYLDYLFHQREERPDGRRGWGLRTEAALIDGGHALVFGAFCLFIGFPLMLIAYALGWIAQRPGRSALLVAAWLFINHNISTWLSGS